MLDKVNRALAGAGAPFALHHVAAGSGYAVALDQAYAKQLAANGGLGATAAFKAAVPDAANANLVLYVNFEPAAVGRLAVRSDGADPNLTALSAAGLSVDEGADGTTTFHLNVITH